ncbi:MAG: hypothetical protein ACKOAX_13170 [Candidatus Kapaibacterium sp.]
MRNIPTPTPVGAPEGDRVHASSRNEIGDKDFDFRRLPVRATKSGTLELDIERFVYSSVFDEVYAELHKSFVHPSSGQADGTTTQ